MRFGNENFATAIPQGSEVEVLLRFTANHFGDLEIPLLSTADFLKLENTSASYHKLFGGLEILLLCTTQDFQSLPTPESNEVSCFGFEPDVQFLKGGCLRDPMTISPLSHRFSN